MNNACVLGYFRHNSCVMNHNSQIYSIQKHEGETLAVLLDRVRQENELDKAVPLTYAGRLDPMAEGLVIVLAGEECKKKDEYLGLDKTYEYEVLFGVETDTFDVLGIPSSQARPVQVLPVSIQNILPQFIGKLTQTYPPYSSKTINGVPLFQLAREGKVSEENLPTIDIEIYSHEFLGMREINRDELLAQVEKRIQKVVGDFRQTEILSAWHSFVLRSPISEFRIGSFRTSCSSGTYIRRIASNMGRLLGTGAIAWKIKRTEIGNFK